MSPKHLKKSFSDNFYKYISILMSVSVLSGSLLILKFIEKPSSAYLYDEKDASINYNVAQLSFDLSSNHMYSYYSDDDTYDTTFEGMLSDLNALKTTLENGTIDVQTFDLKVKGLDTGDNNKYLAKYYSDEFIEDLQKAWDKSVNADGTIFSQSTYNDETYKVYNAYYHFYDYLFIIKNIQLSTVIDSGYSIWYYYVSDLLSKYYGEYTDSENVRYISQNNVTVVSQSTTKIGVKLKGGTTYSSNERGAYYDPLFNDTVSAFTLNLRNSGSVSLFLNYALDMDPDQSDSNVGKGVIGMVLPYRMDFISLKNQESGYSSYFSDGKWNYRGLIEALLETRNVNDCSQLDFAELQTAINEWNTYAIGTYQTNDYTNAYNNYEIIKSTGTPSGKQLLSINTSMIFWADYEQNAKYYDDPLNAVPGNPTDYDMEKWRVDDTYKLINYNFTVKIMSSLNQNYDYSQFTDDDWSLMFNKKQDYNKYSGISNFGLKGYAYFEQDDNSIVDADSYNFQQTPATIDEAQNYMIGGYFHCLYRTTDADMANYIGKLRFNVRYSGYSPAYIRVRLIEQFTNQKGEIVAINQLKFITDSNWHDNRVNDLYYYSDKLYYSTDNKTVTAAGSPKYISIPVITGLQSPSSELAEQLSENSNLTLKITFFIEAVQPNRTEEYWGKTVSDIENICQ